MEDLIYRAAWQERISFSASCFPHSSGTQKTGWFSIICLNERKEKLGQAESKMFWYMSSLTCILGEYLQSWVVMTLLRLKTKRFGGERRCCSIINKTNSYNKAFGLVMYQKFTSEFKESWKLTPKGFSGKCILGVLHLNPRGSILVPALAFPWCIKRKCNWTWFHSQAIILTQPNGNSRLTKKILTVWKQHISFCKMSASFVLAMFLQFLFW